ncbi:uncharacterized protein LOC126267425 [Schistocerca gregaria]|uniref:uncharacterized protein LOC126267425 n=1 Tax=Schistocerca gregaria TaxID=7010 RepID=UPI00211E579D|nr:uncharacterized protein LOC126267425 [Schistocerca gregaria]
MLVTEPKTPQLLLDSPTLARVERARMRQEGTATRSACCQSLIAGSGYDSPALKRGVLWQQRDRLFSRWKERYFVLTRDYLHCFKRASTPGRISDMGQFIFKLKLVDVERVEWINRKSYSTVALELGPRDGRLLLRAPDGLEDWFELLEECTLASKERRRALRRSHNPGWPSPTPHRGTPLQDWLLTRNSGHLQQQLSDSVPDLAQHHRHQHLRTEERRRTECADTDDDERWFLRKHFDRENRLSLLTDIDINSCDIQSENPPSVASTFRGRPTSYRLNSDVFFMSSGSEQHDRLRLPERNPTQTVSSARSVLTSIASFRHTQLPHRTRTATECNSDILESPQLMKFRDRAHSDAQRLERPNWKFFPETTRRTSCAVQGTQV